MAVIGDFHDPNGAEFRVGMGCLFDSSQSKVFTVDGKEKEAGSDNYRDYS